MSESDLLSSVVRYSAFTRDPTGGNRAGIVPDATGASDEAMQHVAIAVGYSETVFIMSERRNEFDVRYFSPAAEVPFCGHATIALGVALADRRGPGEIVLHTRSGEVLVETGDPDGMGMLATLTSVTPRVSEPAPADLDQAMALLGWESGDLHPDLPPRVSFAGASHLILVAARADRLDHLDYEYGAMKALMDRLGWTTIHLAHPYDSPHRHTVRNVFPAGSVREDPATGAAAAAYGAYLRALGAVPPPIRLELRQGEAMGRPSYLFVDVPVGDGGIRVSGYAVALTTT